MQTNEVGGQDIFTTKPVFLCSECGEQSHGEFVDNGFGPYSLQAEPYHCDYGWVEGEIDEHGHFCPGCGTTFYCYENCPEDTPNKHCPDCASRRGKTLTELN